VALVGEWNGSHLCAFDLDGHCFGGCLILRPCGAAKSYSDKGQENRNNQWGR
jgi:hypothetical protein